MPSTTSHRAITYSTTLLRGNPALRRRCRQYATAAQPKQGESLHGFTLTRVKNVPELELTALHFQHDKTGADYLHIAKDDKNNVFTIGFKTNPPDRTGVPHILEHNTLCGSDRYPVRDPFFKMMPRSLNNFMNAMTYPEHTVYPFATTNAQDFKNLMSVYLDATLHPLLRPHDFAQEGWRIGPQDPKSPTSPENPLQFKGVVYNEMKGNMSNADYLFRTRWQDNIFPSLNDSGGDPQAMTDLTHAQLKEFHANHYNPTNSKILTYGDIPVHEHLKQLGPELEKFSKLPIDHDLKVPITLNNGPQMVTVQGPSDPTFPKDQQYKASVTWMMGDTDDVLESFSLGIISSLLLEGYSAPLYQNTIEVGWGASYAPNTGYDPSAKVGMFTIGLSGLKKHDVARLSGGLGNTLQAIKRTGFEKSKVEGRLNQMELSLKHKTAAFGMNMTSRLSESWFNGIDPLRTVAPEEILSAFRTKAEDPAYLTDLFQKYWLNDNTFTFVMEPIDNFGADLVAEEASRLESKIADIVKQFPTPEEATKSMEKQETDLLQAQEAVDDISCLPTVHVKDIPRQAERKETRSSSMDQTKVQWRETLTAGLTYFRAIQTFNDLPDELRIYLPLFSAAIQRLGTKTKSIERLEDEMRLRTGGISVGYHTSTSPLDLNVFEEGIAFSGTAFDRNMPQMYELLRVMVHETDFSKRGVDEKLKELIKSSASTAINDIADSGHSYARRFAEAGVSSQSRLVEETDGLTQVRLMMDLSNRASTVGLTDVLDKLKMIQSFILSQPTNNNLRVALTCGSESTSANEAHLQSFLSTLPIATPPPTSTEQMPYPSNIKSFFPLPYQVYYSASALPTAPYTHPSSPALSVLSQLLTHKRLHPEIREKGGAYGASAYSSALRGVFGYTTYRDPNPLNSLSVIADTGRWAADRAWTERELEEAKLSVFQSVDAPESVNSEGMTRFLTGVDDDMLQARREKLLDVTPAQVSTSSSIDIKHMTLTCTDPRRSE